MSWVSACAEANCVEVRRVGDVVQVRDSKLGDESPVVDCWRVQDWSDVLDGFRQGHAGREWFFFAELSFTDAEKAAFVAGVRRGEFDLERLNDEWRTAESDSERLASNSPDEPRSGRSVEMGTASGPVPGNVHPATQAVLAETPNVDKVHGRHVVDFDGNLYDAEPIAARQAAAVLRWLADAKRDGEQACWCHRCLDDLADEIDPPKEAS